MAGAAREAARARILAQDRLAQVGMADYQRSFLWHGGELAGSLLY